MVGVWGSQKKRGEEDLSPSPPGVDEVLV